MTKKDLADVCMEGLIAVTEQQQQSAVGLLLQVSLTSQTHRVLRSCFGSLLRRIKLVYVCKAKYICKACAGITGIP